MMIDVWGEAAGIVAAVVFLSLLCAGWIMIEGRVVRRLRKKRLAATRVAVQQRRGRSIG